MRKHRTFDPDEIGERHCDEFNEAKNLRELSIIALLYIEYYLNEILLEKFIHPKKVIDENELGSFKNKLTILEALGVFDGHKALLINIRLIQKIRNFYAHNILQVDSAPASVSDKVKQLVYFDMDGNIGEYDVAWEEHTDPLEAQLQVCALETTNQLIEIHAKEKMKPNQNKSVFTTP